jgi:hypothetical protein
MIKNKYYRYTFSNGEVHQMTAVEAYRYCFKKKIDIVDGPGYKPGRIKKTFDGYGLHSSLGVVFRGPSHYRQYLKEHNIEELAESDYPQYKEKEKPVWTEELIRKAINEYNIPIGSILAEALLSGEVDYPDGTVVD